MCEYLTGHGLYFECQRSVRVKSEVTHHMFTTRAIACMLLQQRADKKNWVKNVQNLFLLIHAKKHVSLNILEIYPQIIRRNKNFLEQNIKNYIYKRKLEFLECVNCSSKNQYNYSKLIVQAYIQLSFNIQIETSKWVNVFVFWGVKNLKN